MYHLILLLPFGMLLCQYPGSLYLRLLFQMTSSPAQNSWRLGHADVHEGAGIGASVTSLTLKRFTSTPDIETGAGLVCGIDKAASPTLRVNTGLELGAALESRIGHLLVSC